MKKEVTYTSKEKLFLWCVGAVGFSVLNLAFVYGLIFDQSAILGALQNPISLAFAGEAILLMLVFAYFLKKWGLSQIHWIWFIVLSILGSMAFSLPIALLWKSPRKD